MRKLLFVLLLAFCMPAIAGDSGLYFDQDRNGEGISLHDNGVTTVFFLFTYGADSNCGEPVVSPSLPEQCVPDGQRWFIGVGDSGNVVSGVLNITEGLGFPTGIDGVVGEAVPAGTFTLVRDGDGWLLAVDRFGPALPLDDPIFARIFDLTDLLFAD